MSEILQVVFKKGVLFDITIGRWSALHQMKTKDLLLEKLNRKVIYPGHKKLLPEEASYPLVHMEGKIRTFVRKKSMDFPISGAVFVNLKALPGMLKGLKTLRDEYMAAAQGLYTSYEQMKVKQIQVLDDEARKIAVQNGLYEQTTPVPERDVLKQWLKDQHTTHVSLYPDREKLLEKYYVTWHMFQVNPVGEAAATAMMDEDAEFMAHQQQKLQEDLETWVKAKAVEMHQKLGEAAKQAQQLLAENGKLNPKNLKPLFSAFEEFEAIDFAGSAFAKSVSDIKTKFLVEEHGVDFDDVAKAVNSSTEEFSNLISTIADLAVEDVAKKAGAAALANSEFKRVVEV